MFDRISEGRYWDKPWTLVSGCTSCSPGCTHCKARDVLTHPERLDIPWKRKKPTVFAVWNDLFHEDVPQTFIHGAWDIMRRCENHIFLVLTKRIKRAEEFFRFKKPSPNIWPGVTICNQPEADEKIPLLLQIPAAVRWVSIEPMLGPIDLVKAQAIGEEIIDDWYPGYTKRMKFINWVVLGGETGPGARPMKEEWATSVVNQCRAAGVPVFVKQIHVDDKVGKKWKQRVSKNMDEWPCQLKFRELPEVHK